MPGSYSHSIARRVSRYPLISHGMQTKNKSFVWTKWENPEVKNKVKFSSVTASTTPLRESGEGEANRNLLFLGFDQVPSVSNSPITAGS